MTARYVLVTGSTDGIGRQTSFELARRGAQVIVHGRDLAKARAAGNAVAGETDRQLPEPVAADLSTLSAVRDLAAALTGRQHALHAVINNAGVFMNERILTADGHEMTMAVNHYAPFLLAHLLAEKLAASGGGRVINVSSVAHTRGQIDLDDLTFQAGFDGYSAYAASKLAMVLGTVEFARRLEKAGIPVTVNALHPGVVTTKLLKAGFNMKGYDSIEKGAATQVMLALEDAGVEHTGRYFAGMKPAAMHAAARDAALCARFYEHSCAVTGAPPLPA